ncbi:RNA pyrophosphohydrolase [Roseospira visakhapatnamensis]|uniref:RNA pyrophosphohydrolase n=1 Tax=Roseospira visakhapatnamensis TaxID=390880 RepID=A0A7W6RDT9_9PROT|nr:RNA pyrophosphohydrolase [Roseospira visakhapatnamensis]MBB4266617.1 putative (di)nucleoside polyphosphate hydrolase [Roseospira visakhapatnamensis]
MGDAGTETTAPADDPARTSLPYRRGVGVMLVNEAGLVFVAQRNDVAVDAWQMPQGGVDPGETPRDTALRELAEETGVTPDKVEILARTPDWLRYDLPADLASRLWHGRYRGQEQLWFLMRFTGTDDDVTLDTEHPEFSTWTWVPLERVSALIIPFKRALYDQVVAAFGPRVRAIAAAAAAATDAPAATGGGGR